MNLSLWADQSDSSRPTFAGNGTAFTAQQGANLAWFGTGVGLLQNLQFVLGREAASLGSFQNLRITVGGGICERASGGDSSRPTGSLHLLHWRRSIPSSPHIGCHCNYKIIN